MFSEKCEVILAPIRQHPIREVCFHLLIQQRLRQKGDQGASSNVCLSLCIPTAGEVRRRVVVTCGVGMKEGGEKELGFGGEGECGVGEAGVEEVGVDEAVDFVGGYFD